MEWLQDLGKWLDERVDGGTCDHSMQHVRGFLSDRGIGQDAALTWLEARGAVCDCKVSRLVAKAAKKTQVGRHRRRARLGKVEAGG